MKARDQREWPPRPPDGRDQPPQPLDERAQPPQLPEKRGYQPLRPAESCLAGRRLASALLCVGLAGVQPVGEGGDLFEVAPSCQALGFLCRQRGQSCEALGVQEVSELSRQDV